MIYLIQNLETKTKLKVSSRNIGRSRSIKNFPVVARGAKTSFVESDKKFEKINNNKNDDDDNDDDADDDDDVDDDDDFESRRMEKEARATTMLIKTILCQSGKSFLGKNKSF